MKNKDIRDLRYIASISTCKMENVSLKDERYIRAMLSRLATAMPRNFLDIPNDASCLTQNPEEHRYDITLEHDRYDISHPTMIRLLAVWHVVNDELICKFRIEVERETNEIYFVIGYSNIGYTMLTNPDLCKLTLSQLITLPEQNKNTRKEVHS